MNAPLPPGQARPANFLYSPMFPLGDSGTPWRKLDITGVSTSTCDGQTVLRIRPEALTELAFQAFRDVSHLLRPAHLRQLRAILDDPEASANDRFVALDLLKNANIAAGGVLPMCQDTGTAIVVRQEGPARLGRGQRGGGAVLWRPPDLHRDQPALFPDGAAERCSRRSTPATTSPSSSTSTRLPATTTPTRCTLMFVAKGGGSVPTRRSCSRRRARF